MTTYTADNTQPGTQVVHEGQHISCVSQIDTDTNTLTVHELPFIVDGDRIRSIERKFQRIEVLPSTEFPSRFNCYGEIM